MTSKDEDNLLTAIKVYVRLHELGSTTCHEVLFQFANGTYCAIDLTESWDQQVIYERLGFRDIELIMIHSRSNTLKMLRDSEKAGQNNRDTVSRIADLFEKIPLKLQ